jgi:predicted outer membrane protein
MLKSDLAKTYLNQMPTHNDKPAKAKKEKGKKLPYTPTAKQVSEFDAARHRLSEEEQFNRKLQAAIRKKKLEKSQDASLER